MSLYNMMNGATLATFFVLPMLGHHPDRYPRFRDCFTGDESRPEYDGYIHVYTRTGGGNRESYAEGIEWMRSLNGFVTDFDDDYDSTYASWIFEVPEKWKADFQAFSEARIDDISLEYREQIRSVFPKLESKLREGLGWYSEEVQHG